MPARLQIDTEATGTGLAAAAQDRSTAIAGTDITLPQGLYVSATNALAAGLVSARLANLATRVTAGAATAQCSVATYETTEQASAASLTT
jgi:hypothetical protein